MGFDRLWWTSGADFYANAGAADADTGFYADDAAPDANAIAADTDAGAADANTAYASGSLTDTGA